MNIPQTLCRYDIYIYSPLTFVSPQIVCQTLAQGLKPLPEIHSLISSHSFKDEAISYIQPLKPLHSHHHSLLIYFPNPSHSHKLDPSLNTLTALTSSLLSQCFHQFEQKKTYIYPKYTLTFVFDQTHHIPACFYNQAPSPHHDFPLTDMRFHFSKGHVFLTQK